MDPREITRFDDARRCVHRFESMLKEHSIDIQNGSDLERLCLIIQEWSDFHRRRTPITPEFFEWSCEAVGCLHLIQLLLESNGNPSSGELTPHLQLLNVGSASQSRPIRRGRPTYAQNSNKLFELIAALACGRFATDVNLAHPNATKNDNPDVLFTHLDTRCAFACKCVSRNPLSIFDRIQEGARQIRSAANADIGFVFLNLRDCLDPNLLSPIELDPESGEMRPKVWLNANTPSQLARQLMLQLRDELIEANSKDHLATAFEGDNVWPVVFVMAQFACQVRAPDGNAPLARFTELCVWSFVPEEYVPLHLAETLYDALHLR